MRTLPGPGDPETWPSWTRTDPRSPEYVDPMEGYTADDVLDEAAEFFPTFVYLHEWETGKTPLPLVWRRFRRGGRRAALLREALRKAAAYEGEKRLEWAMQDTAERRYEALDRGIQRRKEELWER